MSSAEFVNFLGVRFLNGDYRDAKALLDEGGLMVVPAAPGLVTIRKDPAYHEALQSSTFAILDSGYLVLLYRIFRGKKLRKLSGLEFLRHFLADLSMGSDSIDSESRSIESDPIDKSDPIDSFDTLFLVNPSRDEQAANHQYLRRLGILIDEADHYTAPQYDPGKVEDWALLQKLNTRRPKYILINLGGGVQEKLGYFLARNLTYKPSILCTGAAIAFLTGHQARIPVWADTLYLGWLWRCLTHPARFVPRYVRSFPLIFLFLTSRE